MPHSVTEDARAVLLPAFDGVTLSDATKRFLDHGGVSILIGESRAEYVARTMSAERRRAETPDTFRRLTAEARARSGLLLAAVDQEIGGICRLHDLVPPFPADLASASDTDMEGLCQRIAGIAAAMGLNVFLAPIADVLVGPNRWLERRTVSSDPLLTSRLSAAYVRGVQRGGVAATVKHFPGFGTMTGDPAVEASAINPLSRAALEAGYPAFRAPIDAGAAMVMVGPSIVAALDAEAPALRSPTVVALLRQGFGFTGVVMADDLDARATLRGDSVPHVAVDALKAGCDYLLLADIGTQLDDVTQAIVAAVNAGTLSAEALAASAASVRDLCRRYATAA
jgi:beta-N-acetylhexosaminidase